MLIGLRTTANSLPQSVFILLVWMKSHPLGFVEILLASENRASSPGMRWPSLCKPRLIAHAWLRGEHPLRVVQFPGAARTQGGGKFLEPFGLVCLRGEPGSPFFFRLKAPRNAIGGFGTFARFDKFLEWLA
jgi:hypothetical protein